jgi:hypothetical protein
MRIGVEVVCVEAATYNSGVVNLLGSLDYRGSVAYDKVHPTTHPL